MTDGFLLKVYVAAAVLLMVGMALLLVRLIAGPSLYDRALQPASFCPECFSSLPGRSAFCACPIFSRVCMLPA